MARDPKIRPASQAGRFYEADPEALQRQIRDWLEQPAGKSPSGEIVALLAPHAGYVYSGAVAATAYRGIAGHPFDRVLVAAPSHHGDFSGAALPHATAFSTPLGELTVDREAVEELSKAPLFSLDDGVHAPEHAIEVQLPFLQVALGGPFQILPLLLGWTDPEQMTQIVQMLADLLDRRRQGGQRWLIVASSDTYHGHDNQACRRNDQRLIELIEAMNPGILSDQARDGEVMACGWRPLVLTMMLAQRAGANQAQTLERTDSAEVTGSTSGYVVGYVAAAFSGPGAPGP